MATEREQLWELLKNLSNLMARTNDKAERAELQRRINIVNARLRELE